MVNMRNSICAPCDKSPQKSIAYAWFLSIILVLIAFICACAAAASQGAATSDTALGFAVVWTVLLMIVLSIGGSLVMRKYRTALAVGFFLGVVVIMSQQMLILFAIFVDHAKDSSGDQQHSYRAFSAFAFFLFIVYGIFAWMLAVFREDIIADDTPKYEEDVTAPPVGV
ncbi:unnamed protein product [Phaeothamnion confervicola]